MNTLLTKILFIACLILGPVLSANSQSSQLEKETRIAERIIEELFNDLILENGVRRPVSSVRVSSEYIPGVGLHFQVNGLNRTVILGIAEVRRMEGMVDGVDDDDEKQTERNEKESKITSADIIELILEYFTNYSPQLQSLDKEEIIRISFGLDRGSQNTLSNYFTIRGVEDKSKLPTISMWVSSNDARKFRDAEISEEEFLESIYSTDVGSGEIPKDISIFSSILETALKDPDLEGLRINRNVQATYLSDWGAEFRISVRAGSSFLLLENMDILRNDMHNLRGAIQDTRVEVQELRSLNNEFRMGLDSLKNNIAFTADTMLFRFKPIDPGQEDSIRTVVERHFNQDSSNDYTEEEILEKKELLEKIIVDTFNDYGGTLTSLKSNEFLRVKIDWQGQREMLPEETQFFSKKSDLDNGRNVIITTKSSP